MVLGATYLLAILAAYILLEILLTVYLILMFSGLRVAVAESYPKI